jgi:2-keto-4-pentenoate hydratase/2-oxohepta-3-ene-1,7-dioic acid hydratase in catechol pathway
MELMRIGTAGDEKAAVSVGGDSYVDLSDIVATYDGAFFATGGVDGLRGVVAERVAPGNVHEIGTQRVGSPIARPHQLLCIGLNYSDHAADSGQRVKGKSSETFNPAGPYLVTPDEIDDVLALSMWLDVNAVRRQTGSTSTMVFSPSFLVHYLSQFMVLEPGDLINTGTSPGVGLGMKPPTFPAPGGVMELGIDGLGTQRQCLEAAP